MAVPVSQMRKAKLRWMNNEALRKLTQVGLVPEPVLSTTTITVAHCAEGFATSGSQDVCKQPHAIDAAILTVPVRELSRAAESVKANPGSEPRQDCSRVSAPSILLLCLRKAVKCGNN